VNKGLNTKVTELQLDNAEDNFITHDKVIAESSKSADST